MDHVRQMRALNGFIIDEKFDFLWADVTKIALGCNGADYRRLFNILCQIPWAALFFGDVLQIAACHIQSTCISIYMIHRGVCRDFVPRLSDKYHKLNLVMIILRTSWIFYLRMPVNDGL